MATNDDQNSNTNNYKSFLAKRSRRNYLKTIGSTGLVAVSGVSGCISGGASGGTPTIKIAAASGYQKFKKPIEKEVGVNLKVKSSSEYSQVFSSWNAGESKQFDIAAPNNDYATKFMNADLVSPVKKDVVTNYDSLYDQFKKYAKQQHRKKGSLYGIPIRFGWHSYSFNSNVIPPDHHQSYKQLFDPKWENKISMRDKYSETIAIAALTEGYKDAFKGEKFSLSQKQLETVKQKLIDQKPLVASYISEDATYVKSLKNESVVIGESGRNEIVDLQRSGYNWAKMANPTEGKMAWFETGMVSKYSDHKQKAWEVIDKYIDKNLGAKFADSDSTPSCNPKTEQNMSNKVKKYVGVDPKRLKNMVLLKPIKNEKAWSNAWEEVKTA